MKDEYDLKKLKQKPRSQVKVAPEASRIQISLKLDAHDLACLKTEAVRLGLPYQTLLNSIVHRFVTGEFVDRKEHEKLLEQWSRNKRA